MFVHNSTTKSRRNTKIGRKVVRATADTLHQRSRSKVKVTLGGCSSHHLQGAGTLRRSHYRATGRTACLIWNVKWPKMKRCYFV